MRTHSNVCVRESVSDVVCVRCRQVPTGGHYCIPDKCYVTSKAARVCSFNSGDKTAL